MRKPSTVILLVAAVLISSCAPVRPAMKEIPLPPQRIAQKGYSVVPLNEPGWLVGFRDQEKFVLGKRGDDPDENIIIRAFTQVLPPLNSEEEFIGFAKSVLVMEGASRHKVLSQETKPMKVKNQPCVRTDTVMDDQAAVKPSTRSENMIIEAYALLCKHPNKSTGILVAYSHRFYQGHSDKDSSSKAQRIFNSIEFLDL